MAKSKSFKFNQHNKRELKVARTIAHSHIFSKDSFMNTGTKTMFYKYLGANLIKPIEGKDGYYSITPKFVNAYQSQIDADYKPASSGSVNHSSGIMRVVSSIIPSTAKIESEGVIKEEFSRYQKTVDYMKKEEQLKAEYRERMKQINEELKTTTILMEKWDKLTEFNLCNKFSSGLEKMCSVPDLRITVDREQISELIYNISNMDRNSEREETYARNAIKVLREIQQDTSTTEVEIYIEITTSNYDTVVLQQKEHISQITNTPIIYFSAPED